MAWHKGSWWPPAVKQWYSPSVSQHFFDPYSFTHLLHGFIFHLVWALLFHLNEDLGILFAFLLELTWEITENSEAVIQRYRQNNGTSADYEGTYKLLNDNVPIPLY